MNTKKLLFLAISSALLLSCGGGKSEDVEFNVELNLENGPINIDNTKRVSDDAHSGKAYSSVDSIQKYGAGYVYIIPDSLKEKNVKVYVSAWVREADLPFEGVVAVSLNNSKGNVAWKSAELSKYNPKQKEWFFITDSVSYTSDQIKDSYAEIGVVGLKMNGPDRLDIDDLKIKVKFTK